jgi:hypothetical protein
LTSSFCACCGTARDPSHQRQRIVTTFFSCATPSALHVSPLKISIFTPNLLQSKRLTFVSSVRVMDVHHHRLFVLLPFSRSPRLLLTPPATESRKNDLHVLVYNVSNRTHSDERDMPTFSLDARPVTTILGMQNRLDGYTYHSGVWRLT